MSGPAYHARTHQPGGTDPLRFPAGGDTLDQKIAALAPAGWWKLNEDSGSVAADSSGNGLDMTIVSGAEDPLWGAPAGPPGEQAANMENGVDLAAAKFKRSWPNLDGSFTAVLWVSRNDNNTSFLFGQGTPYSSGGRGWMLNLYADNVMDAEWMPAASWNDGSGDTTYLLALNPLYVDTWKMLAVTHNADTHVFKLYVEGLLQGEADATTTYEAATGPLWIGGEETSTVECRAVLSYAFLVNRVMTGDELLGLTEDVAGGGTVVVGPGGEVTVDPTPGTDVEHGDGEPDEDPAPDPGSVYAGTPENAGGWHTQAHFEYVVLYDSSPGRFDVPPRRWTRVPFNTVRIQRRWELAVDGNFRDAWLPDDRGLTEHAKQGLLLVTPEMAFAAGDGTVSGWFSIEYPMMDITRMPGYGTVHGAAYMRAARMTNTSNGSVLRVGTGWGNYRQFFEWPFAVDSDDAHGIGYLADNPYPVYLPWAARPLNKPLPYPKLSSAQSLTNYQTPLAHEPGFRLDQMVSDAAITAGDAISLQAWQDSPWLLRFGTDKYPPYTPLDYVEQWRKRPALVIYHEYDPDTVDHDTGVLL